MDADRELEIFFNRLRHARLSLVVVSWLALLLIAKHLRLLDSLYSLSVGALEALKQIYRRAMRYVPINCEDEPKDSFAARTGRAPRAKAGTFHYSVDAVKGLVAVIAGALTGSISLVGFGIDSFIEVTSGAALLWRMSVDADIQRRERTERRALKIVGTCFLALAVYITNESGMDLWSKKAPEHSIPGIVLACVSLAVIPLLSRAKRIGSGVGKPMLNLSPSRYDLKREDQGHPEFVPEHGHRVHGMPVITHMCRRSSWRHLV